MRLPIYNLSAFFLPFLSGLAYFSFLFVFPVTSLVSSLVDGKAALDLPSIVFPSVLDPFDYDFRCLNLLFALCLHIASCLCLNFQGGGFYIYSGTVSLVSCTISNNTAVCSPSLGNELYLCMIR